jgi:hypothetical protein
LIINSRRQAASPARHIHRPRNARIGQITPVLAKYGIASLEEAKKLTDAKGVDVYSIVKEIQTIAFENACWAYILGAAIALTYVQTKFDYATSKLNIVKGIAYSKGEKAKVRCYGADNVREGVAINHHEGVDVSITGNSTNPTRFQHPVAGTYKKECLEQGKKYFSVASGGGTGRTLHPDNMGAGPASYGMTDTMGRMHSDAQFAGSSSVPAHVEMMGFLGMGNNPMVELPWP